METVTINKRQRDSIAVQNSNKIIKLCSPSSGKAHFLCIWLIKRLSSSKNIHLITQILLASIPRHDWWGNWGHFTGGEAESESSLATRKSFTMIPWINYISPLLSLLLLLLMRWWWIIPLCLSRRTMKRVITQRVKWTPKEMHRINHISLKGMESSGRSLTEWCGRMDGGGVGVSSWCSSAFDDNHHQLKLKWLFQMKRDDVHWCLVILPLI